ncbi:MAG TPA: cytochrome c [Steroidobacteraceae bacterium]|nr:cytochrome c [Steroidobacteraceae bacterium]
MKYIVAILANLLGLLGFCGTAHADDEDTIEYRKHVMESLNAQAAILGQIVSGAVPDDNAVQHLDILALLASTAKKSFEAKVPGGDAKPEVWSNWADFSKRMDEFAKKTDEAAKIAHTQGAQAAMSNMLDVLSCKSCHDKYRVEKKK